MKKHQPRKRFGQNFLQDTRVVERMLQWANPQPGQHWLEIGPGQGALTLPLLQRAGALTAIELDRDLITPLKLKAERHGQLHIVQADALKTDICALRPDTAPWHVIGNLPYNISTPLIFHLLAQLDCIADMHFMLQKEVVERLTAQPGSKAWGRLSVMVQMQCEAEFLFEVRPEAFYPPPKVDSAIVALRPRAEPLADGPLLQRVEQVAAAAFNQRRKTLRNNLRQMLSAEAMQAAGIDPGLRPEQLGLEDYLTLARLLDESG